MWQIKNRTKLTILGSIMLALLVVSIGMPMIKAQSPAYTSQRITSSPSFETLPRLGNDGVSDMVVYVSRAMNPDETFAQGDIFYQRLTSDGAPVGAPVQVTLGPTDDELNDVSGHYIVYVAYASPTSASGRVMLYDISTGGSFVIASASVLEEVRICGDYIVWREGVPSESMVMLYDISWLGTGQEEIYLAGPDPSTWDVDIGDRYVVWIENIGSQYDVFAYDLIDDITIQITNTPLIDELEPSTDGAWIAWSSQQEGEADQQIIVKNMDTNQMIVIDNGARNYRPSISGNLIGYESIDMNEYFQVFVYDIASGTTCQVTGGNVHHYLNDVYGEKIGYAESDWGNGIDEDIYVSWLNPSPIADAGGDQTVPRYAEVTLDGSGSHNIDGDTVLTYQWSFVAKPSGSLALLAGDTTANPTFAPDMPGEYQIELTVCDSYGIASFPDTVSVFATNAIPIADAGDDQAITAVGTTVFLDGSQSYDPDGDAISFTWYFVSKPAKSATTLTEAYTATPSFVADVNGEYCIELIVADSWGYHIDSVTVSFENIKPVADAGLSRTVNVGEVVTLDGSGSHDANGDPLEYSWNIYDKPAGSSVAIVDPTSVATSFTPDMPGSFVIQLVVNDGLEDSEVSYISIEVLASESEAVEAVEGVQDVIAAIDPGDFKNENMQNALANKLNQVIANIQDGEYALAIGQLRNDILAKTDGCATSGAPDKNDWILTCEEQAIVYPEVVEAIELVLQLMEG